MLPMDAVQKRLLAEVADLHDVPMGAYNFRANSKAVGRHTTANIDIQSKRTARASTSSSNRIRKTRACIFPLS